MDSRFVRPRHPRRSQRSATWGWRASLALGLTPLEVLLVCVHPLCNSKWTLSFPSLRYMWKALLLVARASHQLAALSCPGGVEIPLMATFAPGIWLGIRVCTDAKILLHCYAYRNVRVLPMRAAAGGFRPHCRHPQSDARVRLLVREGMALAKVHQQ